MGKASNEPATLDELRKVVGQRALIITIDSGDHHGAIWSGVSEGRVGSLSPSGEYVRVIWEETGIGCWFKVGAVRIVELL